MGKLTKDNDGEYIFISDNNITYDLNEGVGLENRKSSDICFIMLGYDDDLLEKMPDLKGDNEYVGYFWGSAFMLDSRYQQEYIEILDDIVGHYEKKHPEIIKYYEERK